MKFHVELSEATKAEINALTNEQQRMLRADYDRIERDGIEFVRVRHLQDKIFEIKTNELRSLFAYRQGQIIVIGVVFEKKSQKTPKDKIRLAKKRLKEA